MESVQGIVTKLKWRTQDARIKWCWLYDFKTFLFPQCVLYSTCSVKPIIGDNHKKVVLNDRWSLSRETQVSGHLWSLFAGKICICSHKQSGLWSCIIGWSLNPGWRLKKNLMQTNCGHKWEVVSELWWSLTQVLLYILKNCFVTQAQGQ